MAVLFVGALGHGGGVQDSPFVTVQQNTLARGTQDQVVGFVESLRGENEIAERGDFLWHSIGVGDDAGGQIIPRRGFGVEQYQRVGIGDLLGDVDFVAGVGVFNHAGDGRLQIVESKGCSD